MSYLNMKDQSSARDYKISRLMVSFIPDTKILLDVLTVWNEAVEGNIDVDRLLDSGLDTLCFSFPCISIRS